MILVYAFIVTVILYVSVSARIFVRHPFKALYYMFADAVLYFVYKEYNKYEAGKIVIYEAHFGGGKTLSGVHDMRRLFNRYNNKRFYDRQTKRWVLQKMLILSNVSISGIYHEALTSVSQFVNCGMVNKDIDMENGTRTCVIGFIDEASSEMNSRNFKSNIDANFLNTLITSRHYNMSLFMTSQKFRLVDALLRSVTQTVVWCNKKWRFMIQYEYDADEMEYATNPLLVKPLRKTGFFIRNADYNSYDTLATVERLDKDSKNGDMLSPEEVLALRGDFYGDNGQISKPSRRFKRLSKS